MQRLNYVGIKFHRKVPPRFSVCRGSFVWKQELLKFSSHFQGFSVSTALFLDVPEDMYIYMGGIKERNTIEAVAIDTSSLLQALHTFLRRIPLFGQLHHKNIGCQPPRSGIFSHAPIWIYIYTSGKLANDASISRQFVAEVASCGANFHKLTSSSLHCSKHKIQK